MTFHVQSQWSKVQPWLLEIFLSRRTPTLHTDKRKRFNLGGARGWTWVDALTPESIGTLGILTNLAEAWIFYLYAGFELILLHTPLRKQN